MRTIVLASHEDLGAALRERAEARGLTQGQMGRLSGLKRTEVAKVYSGLYKKPTHYQSMARALGTTIEAISTTLLRSRDPDIAPDAHAIAVSSLKGGTGKSMTVAHLAGGLARQGWRVLVIDLDDSCQLLHWLVDPDVLHEGPTLLDVLCRETYEGRTATMPDVIVPSLIEGVDLVRSSSQIQLLDVKLSMKTATERRLMRALESVRAAYDFIVFDTAPALDLRLKNALMAADSLLIPLKPTDTDFDRLYRLIPELLDFAEDPDLNPDLGLLGFLLCEVTSVGDFEREIKAALEDDFPGALLSTHVRKRKAYGQLMSSQELIYTADPSKSGDYQAVVSECLERILPESVAGQEVGA